MSHYAQHKAKEAANKAHGRQQQPKNSHVRLTSKKQTGVIPCGKRTDFGYDKDFDRRYIIGKLLGHGQFGYTYVATDKFTGDRVAVKKIEKNKVICFFFFWLRCDLISSPCIGNEISFLLVEFNVIL